MFGWREVFTSFSMTDFAKAREALEQKRVRYTYRTKSILGDSGLRLGGIGVNMNYAMQYYLFVKKRDFEQAQYLIGNALRK